MIRYRTVWSFNYMNKWPMFNRIVSYREQYLVAFNFVDMFNRIVWNRTVCVFTNHIFDTYVKQYLALKNCWGVSSTDGLALRWHIPAELCSAQFRSHHQERTLIFMIVLSWGGATPSNGLSYLPTPPVGQDMTQGPYFKRGLTGLNSEFSFS